MGVDVDDNGIFRHLEKRLRALVSLDSGGRLY